MGPLQLANKGGAILLCDGGGRLIDRVKYTRGQAKAQDCFTSLHGFWRVASNRRHGWRFSRSHGAQVSRFVQGESGRRGGRPGPLRIKPSLSVMAPRTIGSYLTS